jgi:hypothetical protein
MRKAELLKVTGADFSQTELPEWALCRALSADRSMRPHAEHDGLAFAGRLTGRPVHFIEAFRVERMRQVFSPEYDAGNELLTNFSDAAFMQ